MLPGIAILLNCCDTSVVNFFLLEGGVSLSPQTEDLFSLLIYFAM